MIVAMIRMPVRIPKNFVNYPTFANLGLLHNAAAVEAAGCKVRVADALFMAPRLALKDDGSYLILGEDSHEFTGAALCGSADALVISNDMFCDLNGYSGERLGELLAALRNSRPRPLAILCDCYTGGTDYFPYDPAAVLRRFGGLDFVLTGETEGTLVELLSGAAPSGIHGCAYRMDGGVFLSRAEAKPEPALDTLPVPAYHLLDMDSWFAVTAEAVRRDLVHEFREPSRILALQTSRGCPFSCSFCASKLRGASYRAHSPSYVAAMIDGFIKRYGVERFVFLDDAINADRRRFGGICRLMAERRVPWDAVNGMRADRICPANLRDMKAAGCVSLAVSAESGEQRVCDRLLGKRLDLKTVGRTAALARREGLGLGIHYMIGIPGETLPDINKTLSHAAGTSERFGARPLLQYATPIPGTPLMRECREKGLLEKGYAGADLRGAFSGRSFIRTRDFDPATLARLKGRLEARLEAGRHAMLMLDPSYACNSSCTYCCTSGFRASPMDLEAAAGAVKAAAETGVRRVDIGGGEPTMLPWLPDLVRRCAGLGMTEVGVVTNGRVFSYRSHAERLVRAGVTRVSVTVNGPDALLHDAISRVEGAFGQMMAGIGNLRMAGFKNIHANVVACRSNLERLGETVALACSIADGPVNIQPAFPMGAALVMNEFVPSYEDLASAVERAISSCPGRDLRIHGIPPCFLPGREPMLVVEAGEGGRRIRLPGGALRSFGSVAGSLKTKAAYCSACECDITCGGIWRRAARRYSSDDWRPGAAGTGRRRR
jgi:radical SAM superfamily enzyme YgiQ (UPF0313 family)